MLNTKEAFAFNECPLNIICTTHNGKKGYVWAEKYVKS